MLQIERSIEKEVVPMHYPLGYHLRMCSNIRFSGDTHLRSRGHVVPGCIELLVAILSTQRSVLERLTEEGALVCTFAPNPKRA